MFSRFRLLLSVCFLLCSWGFAGAEDAVSLWNKQMLHAVEQQAMAPCLASRNLAIFHGAIHDGLEAINGGEAFVFAKIEGGDALDESLFVHCAATRMAGIFFPSYVGEYNRIFDKETSAYTSDAIAAAKDFAELVVVGALSSREQDGSANSLTYQPKDEIGKWKRTPPSYRPPEMSHWPSLDTFAIPSASAFRPPPPPELDSAEYAEALEEVRRLGAGKQSPSSREESETDIAKYWSCFTYSVTPAGHWNVILASVFEQEEESDLRKIARYYAILNVALADAGIAAWECKYFYEFWRPIDALRMADRDGNPDTEKDESWESLLEAPPHPEYVSGHSAFSGAGAEILGLLFGTDDYEFISTNSEFPGAVRSYNSFWECARECGISRLFGGIHFSFSNEQGLLLGKRVANSVYENVFRFKK